MTSYVEMVQLHPGADRSPPVTLKFAPGCRSGKTCPPIVKMASTWGTTQVPKSRTCFIIKVGISTYLVRKILSTVP